LPVYGDWPIRRFNQVGAIDDPHDPWICAGRG
jgi:hypothetical protein